MFPNIWQRKQRAEFLIEYAGCLALFICIYSQRKTFAFVLQLSKSPTCEKYSMQFSLYMFPEVLKLFIKNIKIS